MCLVDTERTKHEQFISMNRQDKTSMSFELQQLIKYELDVISVSDYI